MDGPNFNGLVLNFINVYRLKHGQSSLFDCGSCSLHVVHGAFKTGFNTVEWDIEKLLRAMFKFFNDAPASKKVGQVFLPSHFLGKTC